MKIVAVHTGHLLVLPLKELVKEYLPNAQFYNIVDDSLITQVIHDGGVREPVALRLMQCYKMAVDIGADYILNACSSVGEVASAAQKIFDTPILRIDEPMIRYAVQNFQRIGVLATLPTTLKPTTNLILSQAQTLRKYINISEGLADAFGADKNKFEKLVTEAAVKITKQVDCIILAQGSMASMEDRLREETGVHVLASPRLCIQNIRNLTLQAESNNVF